MNQASGRPIKDVEEPYPCLSKLVVKAVPFAAYVSLVAAIAVTASSPVPDQLPGIALDSPALFVVERGAVVLAALIVGFGLLGRALRGELPSGFSTTGVTYTPPAVEASSKAATKLESRLDQLEEDTEEQAAQLKVLTEAIETLTSSGSNRPPGR